MIITTTDTIPNKEVSKIIGIANGIEFGLNREETLRRMQEEAENMDGVDAIINVRLTTVSEEDIGNAILAYGTAVKLK